MREQTHADLVAAANVCEQAFLAHLEVYLAERRAAAELNGARARLRTLRKAAIAQRSRESYASDELESSLRDAARLSLYLRHTGDSA